MSDLLVDTKADAEIRNCLRAKRSFYVIAGAGSGKTTSLVSALSHIRKEYGNVLTRDCQRVVCLTYTKRAVGVISARLDQDTLFLVSTLHGFLWGEIKRFQSDIRDVVKAHILPVRIAKKREDDDGGGSKRAMDAREKALTLEQDLAAIDSVPSFSYHDSMYSDYQNGELGHDEVIDVASYLMSASAQLQLVMGQKYPYIFVDEAQDTQENVVEALNRLCEQDGLPLVGYFGDPMQQIYDKRAGDFKGPPGALRIPKEENFRSAIAIVELLNRFRTDIQQVAAGKNAKVPGTVLIRLIRSERPAGPRGRYTSEQSDRASGKLDLAIEEWGFADRRATKHLFLVRQMIARRLGFSGLHKLFTGPYASTKCQDDYENGEHYLLLPLVECLFPLMRAVRSGDQGRAIQLLRTYSPAFDARGMNEKTSLSTMLDLAQSLVRELEERWNTGNVGDVLRFCLDQGLCQCPKRLSEALVRTPMEETYVEEQHALDKGDWLADEFFAMSLSEVERFCDFIEENTVFSTQHGVKGEQYDKVLAVFDDVESAWNSYSFAKTLVPKASGGQATDRQRRLTTNLLYVCFSRARTDLRIVLFISDPEAARSELLANGIFSDVQIQVQA